MVDGEAERGGRREERQHTIEMRFHDGGIKEGIRFFEHHDDNIVTHISFSRGIIGPD
jgi:hypothetical protein